jgi:Carboxypeptidase regulatory-like domain
MKRWLFTACLLILSVSPNLWAASNDVGPVATLNVVVVKDYNGQPIHNAGVVLHSVSDKGKQEKGGLELKTDADGKASYEGIPYGKLRVQVLAHGFQTFGEDYDIKQPTVELTIKLKRPTGMYSVYDDHPDETKDQPAPKPQ